MSESATVENSSSTSVSFDPTIDQLQEGMDPWSDTILTAMILKHRANSKAKRQKLARDWFRSELFYNGIQWITFDKSLRRWRPMGFKNSTPTPVTNTYASFCDVFASLLASIPIEVDYRPLNASSMIDRIKMETANELTEAIKEKVDLDKKQREAAPKLVRHGEVFLIPEMVIDGHTIDEASSPQGNEQAIPPKEAVDKLFSILGTPAPATQEPSPETTPLGQGLGKIMQPLAEKTGLPMATSPQPNPMQSPEESLESPHEENLEASPQVPRIVVSVASALECYMDEDSDSCHDSPFFIHERSFDVGELKGRYPDFAEKISPSAKISGDISRYFAGSLSRLTSGEFGGNGYFVSDGMRGNNRANYLRYWHEPCPNYPEGIYCILVNDNVLVKKGPLPYKDELDKPYKNVIQIRAKQRTKNCHGRTPMDDAIPKQVQRNKLESFIELAIYRMAAPHWLLPKDCGIEGISGEPGSSLIYNRVAASQNAVLKPEMVAGVPPQPVVIQWLEKIDKDTAYILGITDALLGEIPSGLPAARALELAMQRSKERHGDIFYAWSAGWAECLNMLLKIVRQIKPMDLYNTVREDYGGFKLRVFNEGDYELNLDIIPETQQPAPPRSTASEMNLIEDFGKLGLFNMPPNIQYEIFSRFGLSYLNKVLESDKDYIAREHYYLVNDKVVPIVKTFDNHPLHIEDHRVFLQSDQYAEWAKANPQLAEDFEAHISAHQQAMAAAQAQQAQATNPPPPQQQPPPPQMQQAPPSAGG